jgi:uncharacterized protein (DUF1778 family)
MSREDHQMKIRMPAELRDRISAAADRNGRSMNAEIVLALEEAFPFPLMDNASQLYSGLLLLVLHWRRGKWEPISGDDWAIFIQQKQTGPVREMLVEGSNYFALLVISQNEDLSNIVVHHYYLHDGNVRSMLGESLTRLEKEEYDRFMLAEDLTDEEEDRLEELREKMHQDVLLPSEAFAELVQQSQLIFSHDDIARFQKRIAK